MSKPRWLKRLARGVGTTAVGALVSTAGMPLELVSAGTEVSSESDGDRVKRAPGRAQLEQWIALGYTHAPNSTAELVGRALRHLGGLERTDIICSWALSARVDLRHTLAMVLADLGDDVGVPEAIAALTRDRVPVVRIAAEEAATRHLRARWA